MAGHELPGHGVRDGDEQDEHRRLGLERGQAHRACQLGCHGAGPPQPSEDPGIRVIAPGPQQPHGPEGADGSDDDEARAPEQRDLGAADLGADWPGGFFCPCHQSKFDMSGRVFAGMPAPTNLTIPPYKFIGDSKLVIGEDSKA